MLKSFGFTFVLGSGLKLIHDILVFAAPNLQRLIIRFARDHDQAMWKGILYAVLLLVTTSFQSFLLSQYFYKVAMQIYLGVRMEKAHIVHFQMYIIGMWSRTALTSAIYRKALRVSSASKKDFTTGEIVNLMSVDVQRIVDTLVTPSHQFK